MPEDVNALYAYLMTREPVRNEPPENDLRFPFNLRPLLAGWKLLYLDNERFAGLPDADEKATRGAYLVQGLGHCGGCHTPRNALQAEKEDEFLRGEVTENWYAPAIAGDVPAAVKWNEAQLTDYLAGRWVEEHGVALGAMAPVAHNLSRVPDEDVAAISAYIALLMEGDEAEADAEITGAVGEPTDSDDIGAVIYNGACAICHEASPSPFAAGLPLAHSTSIRIPTPLNLVRIVEDGVKPPEGQPGRYMTGFAGALTDDQMVALATYLRGRFTGSSPGRTSTTSSPGECGSSHVPGQKQPKRSERMITLRVNGSTFDTDSAPETPLLYVLRNEMKLNGAKFGCGLGQCGSCTVLADNRPIFSCLTPIAVLAGREVTTLEGLGSVDMSDALHSIVSLLDVWSL